MSTRLDALIGRVTDPGLADQLRNAVAELQPRREFGLVFEHHLPETVELPGLPIRPGVKVRVLPKRGSTEAKSGLVWLVVGLDGGFADLVSLDGQERMTRGVVDMVRVADFADPIYPGLHSTERIQADQHDRPWHTLINAENFHALQALQFTHAGQVDTIYIDPPYNTGSDDWIYNDRHVAGDDSYRHSKWLSFMERRLQLAKTLLKPTGVIICAIGDDEHHRLRMLLDQIFGESNFLANLTWQGGTSALAKHTGGGVDYMLVYAKSREHHIVAVGQWQMVKEGADEVLDVGARCWDESEHDPIAATAGLRTWWRANKKRFDPGLSAYNSIDSSGRIYFGGDLANGMWRPNLQYDILHPVTGKPVRRPDNGWRHERERMTQNIAAGLIIFGPDETTIPTLKRFLDEYITQVPAPSFYKDRRASTGRLKEVLGDKRFPNPKDHSVLMRWIGMVTPADGTVVDFFGGSGSTLEAVLRLNAQDGGTRQCILVTNNEVGSKAEKQLRKAGYRDGDPKWEAQGVCEYVTKPRIKTILTGIRPDGSAYGDTVTGNVEFFDLTYEDPAMVELDLAFERVAPLLWLAAGATGDPIGQLPDAGWAVTGTYAVLFRTDAQQEFLAAVADQRMFFVVTDDEGQFQQIAAQLPPGSRAVRLYESYLRTFQINTGA